MSEISHTPLRPELPTVDAPLSVSEVASTAITVQAGPVARKEHADQGQPPLITQVDYIRAPAPHYPHLSRRLREQGLVVLRVLIDEQGKARVIDIQRSSGFVRLDDAAREAVSRAEFRPYVQGGEARAALVLIPIEFALNQSFARRS
jgi:protein TonB